MRIGGIKKSSLLDFPNKISTIIFTQGCNFNCGFCHNPFLLQKKEGIIPTDDFFEFLSTRKGKIEGVVISGGEPTIQEDLIPFIRKIKNMGFCVKLDTNGSNPDILQDLINENLIDYIAMDIKSPLEKYSFVTNININTNSIKKSIETIIKSNTDYEFRTTFMPYYHRIEDFKEIGELIKGAKRYYLQRFEAHSEINNPNLAQEKNFTKKEEEKIKEILINYVEMAELRFY